MYSERGCETLRSSVSIRCSQKTDPRRNMVSVPQQIHNDRTVPMTSPSCSLTTISCRTRPRGNVDDSCTFNVVIGLLLISACILRTSSTEMGGFGGKTGEWVMRCLLPTNSFLLLRVYFIRLCQFWWKSIRKCERESVKVHADGHTDRGKLVL